MEKKAVIYARYSDEEQSGGYSIQAQRNECHKYATGNGFQIVREYVDEAKSASKNNNKRDNFLEMMLDVKKKNRDFDYIIIHKFDRFSRDAYHSMTQKVILTQNKVKLISVLEPSVGSDEPEGKLMEFLTIGMAEYYSTNLGREALKGMRERVKEGYLISSPPYGFKRKVVKNDRTTSTKGKPREFSIPEIDEIQAQAIRLIFSSYDEGKGYKSITEILNSQGFKNGQGKPFSKNSISYILRNKAYMGVLEWNKTQKGKYRGNTEIITVPNFYPPIIDEQLFLRVQERLDRNSANQTNSYANRTSYLLSSRIVCKECGAKYVGTSAKGGKFQYYTCQTFLKKGKEFCDNKAYNKEKLENVLIEKIKDRILTTENILRYIELFNKKYKEESVLADKDIVAIDQEIAKIENNIKRWFAAIEDGKLDADALTERINELTEKKKILKARRTEYLQKQNKAIDVIIPKNKIEPLLDAIKNRLKNCDFGYKKGFLDEIVDHIEISKKSVILFYKIPIKKAVKNPFSEFFTATSLAPRYWQCKEPIRYICIDIKDIG